MPPVPSNLPLYIGTSSTPVITEAQITNVPLEDLTALPALHICKIKKYLAARAIGQRQADHQNLRHGRRTARLCEGATGRGAGRDPEGECSLKRGDGISAPWPGPRRCCIAERRPAASVSIVLATEAGVSSPAAVVMPN